MLLFFCKYRCFCAIKISANFGVSEEVRGGAGGGVSTMFETLCVRLSADTVVLHA